MDVEPSVLATMFVAIVAALSGFAAQKASVKAAKHATDENSRISMEKEAYERARHFDIETITRQAAEIDDLRKEVDELHAKVRILIAQVIKLESEQRA